MLEAIETLSAVFAAGALVPAVADELYYIADRRRR